jgi:hypothetical protein
VPDAMGNVTLRDLSKASGFTVRQLRYLESNYHLLSARTRPKTIGKDELEGWRRYFRRQDAEMQPHYAWKAFVGERIYGMPWDRRDMVDMMRAGLIRYRRHFRGVTKYYRPQTVRWVMKLSAKSREGLLPAKLKTWSKERFHRAALLAVAPVRRRKKSRSNAATKTGKTAA